MYTLEKRSKVIDNLDSKGLGQFIFYTSQMMKMLDQPGLLALVQTHVWSSKDMAHFWLYLETEEH